jgi:nucleotidyltransferase substrate binding protein (TIGR01987 family)
MTSSSEFSSRDLYGLECCLRDLDLLIERWKKEPADLAVRYSVIKAFELTYQMAVKTLTKYLMENSRRADEVDGFDFQDVIRLADQDGLLQNGWPKWKFYREKRNLAAHVYREDIAVAVSAILSDFSGEAHALLGNLHRRIEQHG